MKEVIREGVFETNSSSAHSVTLKKYNKEGEYCHFVIHSPLYKILFLRGLMANAECELDGTFYWRNQDAEDYLKREGLTKEIARERLIAQATEQYKSMKFSEEEISALKDKSEYELCEIVGLDATDELACVFSYDPIMPYRAFCCDFYKAVREVYCQNEGITDEQLSKKCNEMPYGEDGNNEYRVSCSQFFEDGAMESCNCGFGNYYDIASNFQKALCYEKFEGENMDKIHLEKAKLLLSEDYCFACCEEYCSFVVSEIPETPAKEIL